MMMRASAPILFSLLVTFGLLTVTCKLLGARFPAGVEIPLELNRLDGSNRLVLFDVNRGLLLPIEQPVGSESSPAVSPDGQAMAFVLQRVLDSDIYILNLLSGDLGQITRTPDQKFFITWSPDGTQIAYVALAPGATHNDIHIVDLEDNISRQLADNNYGSNTPSWSPDGRYIVLVSGDRADPANLVVVETDCSTDCDLQQRPLTRLLGTELTPVWSPDGTQIAFIWIQIGTLGIYVVNADCIYHDENCLDQKPRLLAAGNRVRRSPLFWSADSRSIIFSQIQSGQAELFEIPITCDQMPDGCIPTQLTNLSRSFLVNTWPNSRSGNR